jgi:anti-sigma factor NepR-like protein
MPASSRQGTAVDRNDKKKASRRMTVDARKTAGAPDAKSGKTAPGADSDQGLSPALQAHIGRHVRAAFDEVAQEPVPDHLLRLLKDLDQGGDK